MDFTSAFAGLFVKALIIAFVVGIVLSLGGYFLISWLIENVSIAWGSR